MRLTIIPSDKAVYLNGISYNDLIWEGTPSDVHALQWVEQKGWLEFNDGKINEDISELPQWALNAQSAWNFENDKLMSAPLQPTAEQNKEIASKKLYDTDWATIPDISNPQKSNPYLINKNDFNIYRNIIRQFIINPVEGFIDWPVKPKAIWS